MNQLYRRTNYGIINRSDCNKRAFKEFVSNLKANHGIDPTDVLEGDILACFALANI